MRLGWIATAFDRLAGHARALAVAAGAILLFHLHGRWAGRARERDRQENERLAEHAEAMDRRHEALKSAQERRDEIRELDDGARAERLRRWARDADDH